MSTVTKPIALNESFNTTDQTPKNIADVMKKGMQEIAQAIESHQGGGGHVIVDQNGNALDQEPNMTFLDAHLSDNSTDESTDIELIQSVSESDWESATEDGFYDVDIDGAEIGPASDEKVEVVANGTKTYATLLNELYALVDLSKLSQNSAIILNIGGEKYAYHIEVFYEGTYEFTWTRVRTNAQLIKTILLREQSGSAYVYSVDGTKTDHSTDSPTSGTKITLYYGNKSAVIDLQTTSNRCVRPNGKTVESALTWELLGTATSSDYVAIDTTKYNELLCICEHSNHCIPISVVVANMGLYYASGFWFTGTSGIGARINTANSRILVHAMYVNGVDKTSEAICKVYAK